MYSNFMYPYLKHIKLVAKYLHFSYICIMYFESRFFWPNTNFFLFLHIVNAVQNAPVIIIFAIAYRLCSEEMIFNLEKCEKFQEKKWTELCSAISKVFLYLPTHIISYDKYRSIYVCAKNIETSLKTIIFKNFFLH